MTDETLTIDRDAVEDQSVGATDGTSAAGSGWFESTLPYLKVAVFMLITPLVLLNAVESLRGMYLVNLWLVYSVTVIGFYWVFGVAGRFAFCHTFFMALGAYVSAWATRDGRASVWVGLVVALLVTILIAAIIGLALSRSTELFFAVGTLAVLEVGILVFRRWKEFTGPDGTVTGIGRLSVFGNDLANDRDVFWLFLAILGLVLVLAVFVDRSPLRRHAVAARDIPMVARTLGVRVMGVQLLFFIMGSCIAALTGWMLAHWVRVIGISTFGVDVAIGIFLMVVLGGMHSYWGPVAGAAFYVMVPEWLNNLEEYKPLTYAVVLLAVVIVLPNGLAGLFQRHRGDDARHRSLRTRLVRLARGGAADG